MAVEPEPTPFNPNAVWRWHAMFEPSYVFARDEVNVYIVGKARDDVWRLKPVQFEWEIVPPSYSMHGEPSLVLPNGLAIGMFEAMVPQYVGTDASNVVTRIRDLIRQRDKAQQQLDALINGIGRLGAGSGG